MKKLLVAAVVLALFGIAPHVFAQASSEFTALAPIPGLTDTSATSLINADTLANFFNNLYKYLIGFAAILAVIEIIWGGLEYSTQDSVSAKGAGKQRILQAIFGLVLVLSPVLVFTIINPSILNLSLNLPNMKTYTAPASGLVSGGSTSGSAFPLSAYQAACSASFGDITRTRYVTETCDKLRTNEPATEAPPICCKITSATSGFHCCYVTSAISSEVTPEALSGSWCYQRKATSPTYASGTGFVCRDTESACDNYRKNEDTDRYDVLTSCTLAE